MCNFISLVATKSKVFGDGHLDSHEEIIKQTGLKDDKPKELLTFCRVEITPKDNDIFNHDIDNWVLKVDEERTPDWWSDKQEKMCLSRVKEILSDKSIFLIGGEYEEINEDIRFLKDVKIKILRSKLEMCNSSQVSEMCNSSQVGKMLGSSQVGKMLGSSQVGEMWDSSQVGKMWDSSQVGEMLGSNTINIWSSNVVIKEQKNGKSVVIKRYLDNVEVVIK